MNKYKSSLLTLILVSILFGSFTTNLSYFIKEPSTNSAGIFILILLSCFFGFCIFSFYQEVKKARVMNIGRVKAVVSQGPTKHPSDLADHLTHEKYRKGGGGGGANLNG